MLSRCCRCYNPAQHSSTARELASQSANQACCLRQLPTPTCIEAVVKNVPPILQLAPQAAALPAAVEAERIDLALDLRQGRGTYSRAVSEVPAAPAAMPQPGTGTLGTGSCCAHRLNSTAGRGQAADTCSYRYRSLLNKQLCFGAWQGSWVEPELAAHHLVSRAPGRQLCCRLLASLDPGAGAAGAAAI
jgi:hypothetical protein